jgi:L-threonylcarbamoyladenylate synthase
LSDTSKIKKYVKGINSIEQRIIDAFMPGPISIVLEKNRKISSVVTAGLDTVAIRVPSDVEANRFLKAVDLPIAAPSANTSKRPSPTNANDVYEDMNGKIPLIINGGSTDVGVESTVVKVVDDTIYILRPGRITARELKEATGREVLDKSRLKDGENPESPGVKYTHYAPTCDMTLVIGNQNGIVDKSLVLYDKLVEQGKNPVILCAKRNAVFYVGKNHLIIGKNSNEVCSCIFATLRRAEKKYDHIICEYVDGGTMEDAMLNRLSKSCGGNII